MTEYNSDTHHPPVCYVSGDGRVTPAEGWQLEVVTQDAISDKVVSVRLRRNRTRLVPLQTYGVQEGWAISWIIIRASEVELIVLHRITEKKQA